MTNGFWFDHLARRLSRRSAITTGSAGLIGISARFDATIAARCPGRERRCAGRCHAIWRDRRHCGRCGRRCGEGERCRAGECRPLAQSENPRRPFPYRQPYATGTAFPNRPQAALDDDVRAFYQTWKRRYLIREPQGRYRIAFARKGRGRRSTVSEGQGYGMVITALLAGPEPAARRIFDGLWRYVRDHPSRIDRRLMDWRQPLKHGNDSAFDGDADIAYALLLADAQWGSDGAVDYQAAFAEVAAGIVASTIGPESSLPMLGDWVKPDGRPHNQWTPRSSDFMPAHFRAFAAAGVTRFSAVIAASDEVIDALQTRFTTGLLPDFIVPGAAAGSWQPAPRTSWKRRRMATTPSTPGACRGAWAPMPW